MRSQVATAWAGSALLALLGCGETRHTAEPGVGGEGGGEPTVTGLDFAHSGRRLVARGYAASGARIFRTFYDQQLGFECEFVADSAGAVERCVPAQRAALIYTDPDCREPAAWMELLGGHDAFGVGDAVSTISGAYRAATDICPGELPPHREAFRVAERLAEAVDGPPTLDVRQLNEGKCEPAIHPGLVAPAIQRLKPLDETELARGHREDWNVGAGLRVTRLLADDGAELNVAVTGADGMPCEFLHDGECVPAPFTRPAIVADHAIVALDSDCTQPAFVAQYARACGSAGLGVEDELMQTPRVWAVDEAQTWFAWRLVMPITEDVSFACQEQPPDAQGAWAPGAELTGTLPTATKLRRGSGPLFSDWFSVGESELLPALSAFQVSSPGNPPPPLFVNEGGQPCLVREQDDGRLRCIFTDYETGGSAPDDPAFPDVVPITF
jgi:hypothetical protein